MYSASTPRCLQLPTNFRLCNRTFQRNKSSIGDVPRPSDFREGRGDTRLVPPPPPPPPGGLCKGRPFGTSRPNALACGLTGWVDLTNEAQHGEIHEVRLERARRRRARSIVRTQFRLFVNIRAKLATRSSYAHEVNAKRLTAIWTPKFLKPAIIVLLQRVSIPSPSVLAGKALASFSGLETVRYGTDPSLSVLVGGPGNEARSL